MACSNRSKSLNSHFIHSVSQKISIQYEKVAIKPIQNVILFQNPVLSNNLTEFHIQAISLDSVHTLYKYEY